MIKMAGSEKYIDEEGDSKIKDLFEHVIRRTEEILSQSSFGSDDRYVSEVLTFGNIAVSFGKNDKTTRSVGDFSYR